MDYSFFNLETGEMAQLYEPQYASFLSSRYDGRTPVQNLDSSETVYPDFLTQDDLSGPAGEGLLRRKPQMTFKQWRCFGYFTAFSWI